MFTTDGLSVNSDYIGAQNCRNCHKKAYEIWIRSSHARAQDHLPRGKKDALECLFCHATDAYRNLTRYTQVNVQCEACHGPGALHMKLMVEKQKDRLKNRGLEPVNQQSCTRCHSNIRSSKLLPFDYQKGLVAIRHW